MIFFVKNGVRIDETEWVGASPHASESLEHSSIQVTFKNGAQVSLTEDFLRHALELINHDRSLWIKSRQERTKT